MTLQAARDWLSRTEHVPRRHLDETWSWESPVFREEDPLHSLPPPVLQFLTGPDPARRWAGFPTRWAAERAACKAIVAAVAAGVWRPAGQEVEL